MECSECYYYWFDEDLGYGACHADPMWLMPCEEE